MELARVEVEGEVHPSGVGVLRVGGELDFDGVDAFLEAFGSLRAQGSSSLLLDLSDLRFMDSSGVNALLRAYQGTQASGGWMRLACPQPPVRKVIELVCLDDVIPLYPTVGDALAA